MTCFTQQLKTAMNASLRMNMSLRGVKEMETAVASKKSVHVFIVRKNYMK